MARICKKGSKSRGTFDEKYFTNYQSLILNIPPLAILYILFLNFKITVSGHGRKRQDMNDLVIIKSF